MSLKVSSCEKSAIVDFSRSTALEVFKNTKKLPKDAPLVMFLEAAYDYNGASVSAFKCFDEISLSRHCRICYKKIKSVAEFHEVIKSVYERTGKLIDGLIIRGHGNETCIGFSKDELFDASTFSKSDLKAFNPKASILLDACLVGNSLAVKIHEFTHLTVFAPKSVTCWDRIRIHFCDVHGLEMCSNDSLYGELCPYSSIDLAEYISYTNLRANAGNAIAKHQLAMCYDEAIGVKGDHFLAYNLYMEAAKMNYLPAEVAVGLCYYCGRGVEQSYVTAEKWFLKAAKKGNDQAQYWLGEMYRLGEGVSQSDSQAIKYYKLAADQCFENAQVALGKCYRDGVGVVQSQEDAIKWFTRAANLHCDAARIELMKLMLEGIAVDRSLVFPWIITESHKKECDPDIQLALGKCYRDGIGVVQSEEEAIKWFTLVAQRGSAEAKDFLLEYMLNGAKVDSALIIRWLVDASKKSPEAIPTLQTYAETTGDPFALLMLGECFRDGKGVDQSLDKALLWFSLAAAQGLSQANENLATITRANISDDCSGEAKEGPEKIQFPNPVYTF